MGSESVHNDGDGRVPDPTDRKNYPKLIVIRTGEMCKGGNLGSKINFIYSHTDDASNPLTDLSFSSKSQGWNSRFKKVGGSSSEKRFYCDVPNIDDSSENRPTQKITCYYPCNTL